MIRPVFYMVFGALVGSSSVAQAASEPLFVNPRSFCYRTAQSLEQTMRLGADYSGRPRALDITAELIRQWSRGQHDAYLRTDLIDQHASARRFISVARLFESGLRLRKTPYIITSVNELRFIPYAQAGTEIVVITNDASLLDQHKAEAIVAVAERLNLHINIIWYRTNPDNALSTSHAAGLAYISRLTSGRFLDLSSIPNPCIGS